MHVSYSDAKLCLTQFDFYEMLTYLVHMVLYKMGVTVILNF